MTNRWKNYTESELRQALQSSPSISQAIKTLGIEPFGGNYSTIKRYIKNLDIDISHMTGQGWLKGKTHNIFNPARIPLENILVENSSYAGGNHRLKSRLFKMGLIRRECYECRLKDWQGKSLSLELDHINGVPTDNRIENLRLLCPNCHSQTPTWRGRNKKPAAPKQKQKPVKQCLECEGDHQKRGKFCATKCYRKHRRPLIVYKTKITWPARAEILSLVDELGFSAAGRRLGVSCNAIRKHLKKPDIA